LLQTSWLMGIAVTVLTSHEYHTVPAHQLTEVARVMGSHSNKILLELTTCVTVGTCLLHTYQSTPPPLEPELHP